MGNHDYLVEGERGSVVELVRERWAFNPAGERQLSPSDFFVPHVHTYASSYGRVVRLGQVVNHYGHNHHFNDNISPYQQVINMGVDK